ncbi:NUDIX domain-containing protein [Dictyobacter arantiisoli]|uniref:Putative MutT/NUDIX-like protein n=1 Tax=Dictyobacter arantiisoli TaxID=2014874 RepID=A0A5A5T9V6_9CHLR|nr:NUDIX domain-containing protein [Dictyobacter arantiisoli]GCF08202.1 putative MutT/NUDIX-like protein [Dictyobacter arantiisoli]
MKILQGERIGAQGVLSVSSSAVIYDPSGQKVLLTRRSDNGRWCLPGGQMEVGESIEECCVREIKEETGLDIVITRLVGIYSSPHMLLVYADGNRYQIVNLCFEATALNQTLSLSDETTEVGYFSRSEMANLDIMPHHLQRMLDAFAQQILPRLQ